MTYRPLVISHAGCAGYAPEDTLVGVRKAMELGADAVEVDVHTSAEGIPIVIHDHTIERTLGGRGNVHTIPLAELKKLDAAANRPDWPQPEPVPTLEEVVRETRGHLSS